jgi:hypothetical protein
MLEAGGDKTEPSCLSLAAQKAKVNLLTASVAYAALLLMLHLCCFLFWNTGSLVALSRLDVIVVGLGVAYILVG